MDVLVATVENVEKKPTQKGWVSPAELGSEPHSSDGRAAGSPTAGSQLKGLPKTQGARLVWLALKTGKVQDQTVSCTHISQVSLAKI